MRQHVTMVTDGDIGGVFCDHCSLCVPKCSTCHDALVPTGPLVTSLLQCVWTQWDDPVEVCVCVCVCACVRVN